MMGRNTPMLHMHRCASRRVRIYSCIPDKETTKET